MTTFRFETTESMRPQSLQPAGRESKLQTSTEWPTFDVALLSVEGQIDADSSAELLDYALSKALVCRLLILNLGRVSFLPSSGYDMLRTLERRCAMADVKLTVLHGTYASLRS